MNVSSRGREFAPRAPLWARGGAGTRERVDHAIIVFAIMALGATLLLGMPAAALFIAASLVLIARNPAESLRTVLRYSPLLLIPLLAMASTIWSDAPQRTLRAAIQLLLTMLAALMVARKFEPRQFVLTMFVAFAAVSVSVLPYVPSAIASGNPPIGLFGSKNQVGMNFQIVLALALAVLFDRTQPNWARLATIVAIPLSIGMLWLSQSATAQTSAGVALILFPTLLLLGRVPLSGRIAVALIAVAMLIVALAFMPVIVDAIGDFRQNVLNKNSTLTGRTYLWEYAARLSAERPLLGHGYYAFWRIGNLDAEGLWRWGGIATRMGFNFHNSFIEMKVDLGYVGQVLLFATCAAFASAALYRQLLRPTVPMAFFLCLQVVLYLRSYAETGLLAPFGLLTVLWIASGVYALSGTNSSPVAKDDVAHRLHKRRRLRSSRDPIRA